MRDIVYKRVSVSADTPSQTTPVPPLVEIKSLPPLPKAGSVKWYEKALTKLNEIGGLLVQKSREVDLPQVVTETVGLQPTFTPTDKITKEKPRRKRGEKIAKIAQSAKAGLKTRHGKLIVANSLAIILIGGYAIAPKATQNNTSQTESSSLTRRYLPDVQRSTASDDFSPTSVTTDATKALDLYTWASPWNTDSVSSQISSLSGASAFWLTLREDGVNFDTKSDWAKWEGVAAQFRQAGKPTYVTITGDPNFVYKMLTDSNLQDQHIAALLSVVRDHGFDGIDIDYEGLGSENSGIFTSFVRNLSNAFHADHKQVSATVEARIGTNPPMDWQTIGQLADEIRIMVYDYHSRKTGNPGPVAPLGWVQEITTYATSIVKPNKVVIGLGNYGYDWTEPSEEGGSWEGTGVSHERAVAIASEQQTSIVRMTGIDERGYDIGSIPSFTYRDTDGKQHSVWFEDKTSLQEKVNIVKQFPVKGVIFWSVGLGDPTFWNTAN